MFIDTGGDGWVFHGHAPRVRPRAPPHLPPWVLPGGKFCRQSSRGFFTGRMAHRHRHASDGVGAVGNGRRVKYDASEHESN